MATAEVGTAVLGPSRLGAGALAGLGAHKWTPVGLDLMAEVGLRAYSGVEDPRVSSFGSTTKGASANIPYVGLRLGLDAPVGAIRRGHARPLFGFGAYVRYEPVQVRREYVYTDSDWFSGRSSSASASATIGGATEFGLALRVGFDLAR